MVTAIKTRSCISISSATELPIESEDHTQRQQVLARRQADHAGRDLGTLKETAVGTARVVVPVLQPKNRIRLPVWHAQLKRGCNRLYRLGEAGDAAVPVPVHFRPHCRTPVRREHPMER